MQHFVPLIEYLYAKKPSLRRMACNQKTPKENYAICKPAIIPDVTSKAGSFSSPVKVNS